MGELSLTDFTRIIESGGETYQLNSLNAGHEVYRGDVTMGYWRYWMQCRLRYAEEVGPQVARATQLDALQRTGLCQIKALSSDTCARLRDWIDQAGGRVPLKSYDLGFVRQVLEETFSPENDAILKNHFSSHYFVPFINFFRTDPGMEDMSYHWHCDWGPTGHLKLFCYLADSDSHDGSTIFLDRGATTLLQRAGYVFGQDFVNRNMDLEPLCRELGIAYAPQDLRPDAGDAALFEPAGVIHRGNVPKRGHRYVMQVGIIPSMLPWTAIHDQIGALLHGNNGDFPDANELLKGSIKF